MRELTIARRYLRRGVVSACVAIPARGGHSLKLRDLNSSASVMVIVSRPGPGPCSLVFVVWLWGTGCRTKVGGVSTRLTTYTLRSVCVCLGLRRCADAAEVDCCERVRSTEDTVFEGFRGEREGLLETRRVRGEAGGCSIKNVVVQSR